MSYLGLIISTKGIYIDLKKVKTVLNQETFICVRNVQAFIGFANFYHCFIKIFSNIVYLIIATVKKNTIFYWNPKYQRFFELLKKRFIIALILAYFDFEKEYILETDSSDNVSIKIFFQYRKNKLFYLIIFFFCKHSL